MERKTLKVDSQMKNFGRPIHVEMYDGIEYDEHEFIPSKNEYIYLDRINHIHASGNRRIIDTEFVKFKSIKEIIEFFDDKYPTDEWLNITVQEFFLNDLDLTHKIDESDNNKKIFEIKRNSGKYLIIHYKEIVKSGNIMVIISNKGKYILYDEKYKGYEIYENIDDFKTTIMKKYHLSEDLKYIFKELNIDTNEYIE